MPPNQPNPVDRPPAAGLRAELAIAVVPRTAALVLGVLFIQLAFILSYVGAFHHPRPHGIAVDVAAPPGLASRAAQEIGAAAGSALRVTPTSSAGEAARHVRAGSRSAAIVLEPGSRMDELLVASGGGASVVSAVEAIAGRIESARRRPFVVHDMVPLQAGDARGLSGFYLVIGWIVGGYLVASLLGVARGSRPANLTRAGIRLAALGLYALASGIGGALIVGPVLGALGGHFLELAGVGALVVFAAGAVTTALQVLLGVLGIGLTVLLFVVLGNPSAGGAYQTSLLPGFWRALGNALPNGAATDTVRRIVYFGGSGIGIHLLVITVWAIAGAAVALLGAARLSGAARGEEPRSAA